MRATRFDQGRGEPRRARIRPGQTLENPVTGERFTFIQTAASSGGKLLSFELGLKAGGAVPIAHVHPTQTETFRVIAGEMHFRLRLRTVVAEPGETVVIEPGVAHSFANRGEEEARVLVEVRPALTMERMFADVIEMAESGRLNSRGMPRNVLDLALLARTYDRVAHAPVLGVWGQRLALAPLVGAAKSPLRRRRSAIPAGPLRGRSGIPVATTAR